MEASRATAVRTPAPLVLRHAARDYVALTKPKVQSLLLFTTVCAMFIAGSPSIALVIATLIGGAMSAGGSGAINHWYDRDIDLQMERTADRPVAAGRISPRAALTFGIGLGVFSVLWLALLVNPVAAALSLAGFLGYSVGYTMLLKRNTWQNIVWGGAAGAVPPLVGWAAVTGSVSGMAVILFFIVFFWTPPHFWALSLLMKDEYAKVGIPMLPVVRGEQETRRQILLYSVLLYAVTQLPFCVGAVGMVYLVPSMLLGFTLIGLAWNLKRRADRKAALRVYLFSLLYLAALFAAMVADVHI